MSNAEGRTSPTGGGAQDKTRVTVYLTPEVRDNLRRIAYEEDVPLTRAISRVIDEGLKARSEAAAQAPASSPTVEK